LNTKEKIILIGGGGHCRACIDVIEHEGRYQIAGIIDHKEKLGEKILGYEIIGVDKDIVTIADEDSCFLITIGHIESNSIRVKLFNVLKGLDVKLPVITSPLAYVSKHAKISDGTIIMHHAIINASARVGVNCIINSKTLIEHDAIIGDHCHISTNATINGGVIVGDNTFFGSCAVSVQNISIPPGSFIKANSLRK